MNFNNYIFSFVLALASVFSFPAVAAENASVRFELTSNDTLSAYPNTRPVWTSKIPTDIDTKCLSSAIKQQTHTFTCNSTKSESEKISINLGWIPVSGEVTRIQYQITLDSTGPTIVEQAKKEGYTPGRIGDITLFHFYLPVFMLLWVGFFSAKENKKRLCITALYCAILIGVAATFAIETTFGRTASVSFGIIAALSGAVLCGILGSAASVSTVMFVYVFSTVGKSDEFFTVLVYLKFLSAACLASFVLRELTALFLDRDIWMKKLREFYLEYKKQ
ncbi:MAG: hypothetical protein WCG73_00690 [Candidatus Moraniibacteriota bacterium]